METGASVAPARDEKGRLLPGAVCNPKGRPKGSKNKVPGVIREWLLQSLEELGGVDFLIAAATDSEPSVRVAYLNLLKAVIPKQVEAEVGASLEELLQRSYELEAGARGEVIDVAPEAKPGLPSSVARADAPAD
jgi:hypothetical protein